MVFDWLYKLREWYKRFKNEPYYNHIIITITYLSLGFVMGRAYPLTLIIEEPGNS